MHTFDMYVYSMLRMGIDIFILCNIHYAKVCVHRYTLYLQLRFRIFLNLFYSHFYAHQAIFSTFIPILLTQNTIFLKNLYIIFYAVVDLIYILTNG